MSKQVSLRLPDHLVEFLDDEVRSGAAPSRAALAAEAIARLERQRIAAREVAEIAAFGGQPYPDLAEVPGVVVNRANDVDYDNGP